MLGLAKEGIPAALGSNVGYGTVTWDDPCLIGEREQSSVDRVENLLEVSAGKICSANTSSKEGVTRRDEFERNEM